MTKRILNMPNEIVQDMAKGFIAAYGDNYEFIETYQAIKKKDIPDRVIIFAEGGCGLEPWCIGYLGNNLADVCCIGNVFAAPSAYSIYEMGKRVYNGKGIVFIFGNFAGDYLNHDMASELLDLEGIPNICLIMKDDIASAPKDQKEKRGGIAGLFYLTRCIAAAAEHGYTLQELDALGNKIIQSTFTIPVVLESGSMPDTGEKMFEIQDDTIEFGLGFNGEPGILTTSHMMASRLVDTALGFLYKEIEPQENEAFCVLVNAMGALTFMENHIIANCVKQNADANGINISALDIAEVMTSQDMRGFSITFMRLDDEIKKMYEASKQNPIYSGR